MELILGLAGLASAIALAHANLSRKRNNAHVDVPRLVANDDRNSADEARQVQAALAREARDISLLVAVSGSIVNMLATGRRTELRSSIAAYLPPQPIILPAAFDHVARMGGPANKTVQNLIGFYALVNFARTATLVYAEKFELNRGSMSVDIATLAEAWQAAATQSIGVLSFLDAEADRFAFGTKDKMAAERLRELLRGVTLGRAPCVRLDGVVIVPGWVERRAQVRRQVDMPAQVAVNGANHKMVVRDISAEGLGLEGEVSVKPGDRVNIALDGGTQMEGVAVWNCDGRVGVKLNKRLPNPVAAD